MNIYLYIYIFIYMHVYTYMHIYVHWSMAHHVVEDDIFM